MKGFLGAAVAAAVIALARSCSRSSRRSGSRSCSSSASWRLVLDAVMLLAADRLTDGDLTVDGFWSALLVALVASAVTL